MARSPRVLYALLFLWMAISMAYYVAGVAALNEKWFHGERHGTLPFDVESGGALRRLENDAKKAGFQDNDVLETLNGRPFTGDYQLTNYLTYSRPGDVAHLTVRSPDGRVKSAAIQLQPMQGPNFSLGGYIAYLTPVLGVTLLSLLVGYWVVAARPGDPNAWLVLALLTFPEASFGDIQAAWWGGPWYIVFGIWGLIGDFLALPALLWFGLFFPERGRIDRRWPTLKWLIVAVQFYSFAFYLWFMYLHSFNARQVRLLNAARWWTDEIKGWAGLACILIFLIAIFGKLRSASTPDARRRLRVLAWGSGLSLGPLLIMFGLLPLFGYSFHYGSQFAITIPFFVLFPLTLAYVLVVQRAMDLRVLLRMGTKYVLAQATLNVLLILIAGVLVLRFIVPTLEQKQHQTVNLILIGAIAALLLWSFAGSNSLSTRLRRWLDTKFFREAYNAEIVLSDLSEQARRLPEKGLLIETVARRISEVLHVAQISVWLRGSSSFQLQYALGFDAIEPVTLTENSSTLENLARTNRPATVYRDRPEEWLSRADSRERLFLDEASAELLLPLPGHDRLLGLMTLGAKKSEEPYTPTDLRVLQSVATQTGLALEVNELAQSLAKEAAQRARIDREIEIAHEVQERLFPQQMPCIAGLSLAGFCRPAQGVGGDYYDAFELPDGRLGLAVADVSGKGISAALLMASLRACLRTLTLVGRMDLSALMQNMNQLVYESSAVNRYATFFFAIYDPSKRGLSYVNAGHNPPILLGGSNGAFEEKRLEAGGPVIGLLPHVSYEEQSLTLEPGDVLLTYTDGVSEAMTAEDEEWGEERMISAAEKAYAADAEQILHAIFVAADEFTAKAPQHDDMTLLVMKLS